MSKLTDFFPKAKGSDYGVSGDPLYIVNLLMIGGGSGASIQCSSFPSTPCSITAYANYSTEPANPTNWRNRSTQGTGGGIFFGQNVAVYPGVSIPITVGAAGANSPNSIPVAGTPTGKGSPGSPSTFGCITAYGGGAPATVGTGWTSCVSGDSGGIGGYGWGRYNSPVSGGGFGGILNQYIDPAAPQTMGVSYNFANMFGVHRGSYRQSFGCYICSYIGNPYCNPFANNDPKYVGLGTSYCSMSNYFCLNVNNVPVTATLGHAPIYTVYPALQMGTVVPVVPAPVGTVAMPGGISYPGQGFGITKCHHANIYACCITPFVGYTWGGIPSACSVQYCPNTGTGGDGGSNATGGAVWVVYPDAYPAASSFTGGVDCTPCVKTGFRAYRWFSPGSFTMP